MNLDNLKTLIDAGDHDGVVTFFANASEAERTGVAGYVLERLKEQQSNNRIIEIKPGTFAYNSKLRAAELAAIAACSLSQLKHLGNGVVVAGPESSPLRCAVPSGSAIGQNQRLRTTLIIGR